MAVSVWGGISVVVRLVEDIDGLVLGFHRLWIGALATLVVFYAIRSAAAAERTASGPARRARVRPRHRPVLQRLKHTTIANATVVGALQPALVFLVAGRMFGERVTAPLVAWSVAAVGGVAVVVYGSSGVPVWSLTGDLLAIGALFAWTVYFVASKQVRSQVPPFEYLVAMLAVATLAVAPVALLSGQRLDPGGLGEWGWIATLAIGSGGFGHLLLNWAHGHVELAVMSLLTLAVPVVAVISAACSSTRASGGAGLGMAMVLVALAVVVLQTSRPAAAVPAEPVTADR